MSNSRTYQTGGRRRDGGWTVVELMLPTQLRAQPVRDCAALLVLGQGFDASEFNTIATTLQMELGAFLPFNQVGKDGGLEGRVAILADACVGGPTLVEAPDHALPRVLRLADDGAVLESLLEQLVVPLLPYPGEFETASTVWSAREPSGGGAAKLIVILRKPAAAAGVLAEYYGPPTVPVVAVDVTAGRRWWWLVVIRALAQLVAGLGDEFTRSGDDWAEPPAEANLPDERLANPHRLGRNLIVVRRPEHTDQLGTSPIRQILTLDPVWRDPLAGVAPTPYRPAGGAIVLGESETTSIRLTDGGGGFRRNILRYDARQPCLMAQVPANPTPPLPAPAGPAIGETFARLCPVCEALVARALGRGWRTAPVPVGLDHQNNQFNRSYRALRPRAYSATAGTSVKVRQYVGEFVRWEFTASVDSEVGLRISALQLLDRPLDPMSDSADVAESITFGPLSYTVHGQEKPKPLDVRVALANKTVPPWFGGGTSDDDVNRAGVKLVLTWHPENLEIRAEMSLVCHTVAHDFDPGGAVSACRFYPELTMTWSPVTPSAPTVTKLTGSVNIVATNRMEHDHSGHHPDLPKMPPNRQVCSLFTDSNNSSRDHEYRLIPSFPPNPADAIPKWISGRLMGKLDDARGWLARASWKQGVTPPLPEWSWLFDYGRRVPTGGPSITEVVVWEETSDRNRARVLGGVQWPPNPDPNLATTPGARPLMSVVKNPRQGAYDNVHLNADMGTDKVGRQVIAAPFCADVCLHLHWRWGDEAAKGAERYFYGWSSGPAAQPHRQLGAPLVPPNQRITLTVRCPDAAHTHLTYHADAFNPRRGRRQVFLEQGLAFAFNYAGLKDFYRGLLAGAYGDILNPIDLVRFVSNSDPEDQEYAARKFFQGVYEQIRLYSYGFAPPGAASAPQQIPTDTGTGKPFEPESPAFRGLVNL